MTMPSLPSVALPYRLGLKLANTVVYFSLVLLHIYNTFFYVPEYPNKETFITPWVGAFWVWPLIHLLLISFTIFQWDPRAKDLIIDQISYRFVILGLINAAYFYFEIRRWYILSFLLTLGLSSIVSSIYYIVRTRKKPANATTGQTMAVEGLIRQPFSLYHAWSIVLGVITLFQAFGKDIHKEHASIWTRIFVFLALFFLTITSIGYAYASEAGDLAGTAVITYVLFAIFQHQQSIRFIHWSSLVLAIISALSFLVTLRSTYAFLSERYQLELVLHRAGKLLAREDAEAGTSEERQPLRGDGEDDL